MSEKIIKEIRDLIISHKIFYVKVYDKKENLLLSDWGKTLVEARKIIDDYLLEENLDRKKLIIETEMAHKKVSIEELTKLIEDNE